jgi:hypothetical protein
MLKLALAGPLGLREKPEVAELRVRLVQAGAWRLALQVPLLVPPFEPLHTQEVLPLTAGKAGLEEVPLAH